MLTGTQNVLMRNEIIQCLWPVFFNPEIQFSMDYTTYKYKNILLHAEESFHILTKGGRETKPFAFEYRLVFSTRGNFFSPREHLAISGDLFSCHSWVEVATGI